MLPEITLREANGEINEAIAAGRNNFRGNNLTINLYLAIQTIGTVNR